MNTNTYKKDFSNIGIRMLVSTAVIILLQLGVQTFALTLFPEWQDNVNILFAVTMAPLFVLGYPISFVLMRNKDVPVIEKHHMSAGQLVVSFLICYGLLIIGNLIGLGLTAGIGLLKGSPVQNALLNVVSGGSIWVTAIFTVLCAPVFEEILFRKLICDKIIKYGEGCTIMLSGLIFGLFHMNFNQFFYAFFLGCFLAFIYVKTGNLKYTILLHMIVNFFGTVLGGMLFKLDPAKPSTVIISTVYSLCVFAMAIAGIVLLIVKRRAFVLKLGEIVIEKGQRFKTMILNVGMALYCLVFLGIMLVQAFLV